MTWWSRHLRRIVEFCDGTLTPAEHARAAAHLEQCAPCRAAVESCRFSANLLRQVSTEPAPDHVWSAINAALDARPRENPAARDWPVQSWVGFEGLRLAGLALVAAMGVTAGIYYVARPSIGPRSTGQGWEVTQLQGAGAATRLAVGQSLETDAASRVRLAVGEIGSIDVDPNTRVRLVAASDTEQRLALDRGAITATINAPPRRFIVDTPASTVFDLGCQYTMNMDEGGEGSVTVTVGWISLEWAGRESLVPAGASCQTRRQVGPGMPVFNDGAAEFKRAVQSFDFENGGQRALGAILAAARVRDTLTLWHLIARVDPRDRLRVVDRIAELTPLPQGVSRDKALQLDPDTLRLWREELAWTW